MVRVGVALLIVGIAFKISAVPFHLWTPDVYQGAPTPTTGFLAAASKTAAVVVLLRIVYPAVATDGALWGDLWPWMAAITMIVGNLIALVQHDVKRVLAYSSIAHVGFILMALAGGTSVTVGGHSALFYLVAYVLGTIGAFAAISAIAGDEEDRVDLDQIRGLARSHPLLAGLLALFLLSLSGLPPLVGFAGKLFAFKSAITGGLYYLAIFAALNSAMAVYYYLRIIIRMYMEGRAKPLTFKMTPVAYLPLLLVAAAVIYVGIAPGAFLAAAEMSVRALAPMASLAWLP
jgi:NADH-quinone oxidoreductase subunit N